MSPAQRDYESEVIVVGFGGAGAIAAIAAADAGATVIVIEKCASGGGATRLSSGGIMIPQRSEFANYLSDIWLDRTPRPVVERLVQEAMRIEEYCTSIGVDLTRWPGNSQEVSSSYPPLGRPSWPKVRDGEMLRIHATAPDERPVDADLWAQMANSERVHHIGRPYGVNLWEQLRACVEARGIPVHHETCAKRLVTDENGAVTGVIAEREGRAVDYTARRAVIMTTGGFSSNQQMQRVHLSCPFVYAGSAGCAHGDGHVMTQRVGARQWHMQTVCGQIGFKAPDLDQAFQIKAPSESFVWVDRNGRRYTDETSEKLHNTWRKVAQFEPDNDLRSEQGWPRVPVYMVFDEIMRKSAPLARDWRPDRDYSWSLDNSEEIERGWIRRGATLSGLAAEMGTEAGVLEATVDQFNHDCRAGCDSQWGRDAKTMAPIEQGPFYALPLMPMLISTHGGPEHDEESRVLGFDGAPISRLYAAGELSSVVGWLYEAGIGHAECIAFGRIAGENAAHEPERELV